MLVQKVAVFTSFSKQLEDSDFILVQQMAKAISSA